jgi:hypothetical protein
VILALSLLLLSQLPENVKNEPIAAKRWILALDAADSALTAARQSAPRANLELTAAAAEAALEALRELGKPYKNSKHYKRAELRLRDFLKRADGIVKSAGIEDRPPLEAAYSRLNTVHELVLQGVMSRKE